jgi:hypothetical protein
VALCNIAVTVGTLDFHNLMDRLPNALGVAKPAAEVPDLATVREDESLLPMISPRTSAVAVQV